MSSADCREWLGLDIGGANLKACDGDRSFYRRFELWKAPEGLVRQLDDLRVEFAGADRIAVTMTGELCDCFAGRDAGVRHVVNHVMQAFQGCEIHFYQTTGKFVAAEVAVRDWLLTAASNWHALGRAASRHLPGQSGILIDIGSTTTDIIPLEAGEIAAVGETDFGRLSNGELVYTGVQRSPVFAVAKNVNLFDRETMLAPEWFASMADVYLVLGRGNPVASDFQTCDGRPFDRVHSLARLARCVCSDPGEIGESAVEQMAEQAAFMQSQLIRRSLRDVVDRGNLPARDFVVAGEGEWLAEDLVKRLYPAARVIRLSDRLGVETSRAAAAWAVRELASNLAEPE